MSTSPSSTPSSVGDSLRFRLAAFADDIKIQHTVFALPWAILSAVLAGRTYPGSLVVGKLVLILVCMVTARTVAMSANRVFDAKLDADNPRTARRAIPSGRLSMKFFVTALIICCLMFLCATALFEIFYRNIWPLALSVPVLAYLWGYPLMKRFSRLCHFYLGIALALAPVCAWLAISGRLAVPPLLMFVSVTMWTAGFDIIYACQDYENDVAHGLFSVPSRLGIPRALLVSRICHVISAAAIFALGLGGFGFGIFYGIGAVTAVILLIVEQSLVSANDLSKVNIAFFTVNGMISLLLGTLGIIDLIRG